MPLNPQIPLSVNVPTIADMSASRQTYHQMQDERRQRQDRKAIEEAFAQTNGDLEQASTLLRQNGRTRAASALEAQALAVREQLAKVTKAEFDNQKALGDEMARIVGSVRDIDSHAAAYTLIRDRYGQDAADQLGAIYDPARIDAVVAQGLSVKDRNEIRQKAVEVLTKATREALTDLSDVAALMYAADDADDWNTMRAMLPILGVRRAIIDQIPDTFSPEARDLVMRMSMSPKDLAEMNRLQQAADTATANAATSAQRAETADRRETRLGGGGPGPGPGPVDPVLYREAVRWRRDQILKLDEEREKRLVDDPNAVDPVVPMTEEEYARRLWHIERRFATDTGQPVPPEPGTGGAGGAGTTPPPVDRTAEGVRRLQGAPTPPPSGQPRQTSAAARTSMGSRNVFGRRRDINLPAESAAGAPPPTGRRGPAAQATPTPPPSGQQQQGGRELLVAVAQAVNNQSLNADERMAAVRDAVRVFLQANGVQNPSDQAVDSWLFTNGPALASTLGFQWVQSGGG